MATLVGPPALVACDQKHNHFICVYSYKVTNHFVCHPITGSVLVRGFTSHPDDPGSIPSASMKLFTKFVNLFLLIEKGLMPQVFNIPKVEHDQPCSTLVVIVFQISLFIYVILGPDWSMAKVKVNKQTNLQKQ